MDLIARRFPGKAVLTVELAREIDDPPRAVGMTSEEKTVDRGDQECA
jgi:hypothetical protein